MFARKTITLTLLFSALEIGEPNVRTVAVAIDVHDQVSVKGTSAPARMRGREGAGSFCEKNKKKNQRREEKVKNM